MSTSLLEKAAQLFGLVTTTSDHDTGSRELRADDEEGPRSLVDLGLHGFYSLARKGVGGLAVKMLRGGYLLRAWTGPPSDAAPGEAGIYLNGATIRVRPDGRVDIIGADLTDSVEIDTIWPSNRINIGRNTVSGLLAIARNSDPVLFNASFLAWCVAINSILTGTPVPLPPLPLTQIGTVSASSTKVYGG